MKDKRHFDAVMIRERFSSQYEVNRSRCAVRGLHCESCNKQRRATSGKEPVL
jgi:hypothetical protein